MTYTPDKTKIARRIAGMFRDGDVVNLGIGLPTLVGDYIPRDVEILLQSENGFLGLGPQPPRGEENPDLINAGAVPVTILPGGSFFDSAVSFGIIRGGHLDYTVLGVLTRCSLPLTAACEVDYVVTDVGLFEVADGRFVLNEYFAPATPEWIVGETEAAISIAADCREYRF